MLNKNIVGILNLVIFLILFGFSYSDDVFAIGGIPIVCGNGVCDGGEDFNSCPNDCSACGDGVCDESIGETPITCSADCHGSFCGDGTCDASENAITCSADCSVPSPDPDPGAPSPSCEDVTIKVGEETTCSIKVENIETFPLTEVTATVTIPNNIKNIDNTNSWNCTSTAVGIKCDKIYNPYLVMGEIEYLELTFTSDVKSVYGLATKIEGKGMTVRTISYTSSQRVTIAPPPATANAVNDYTSSGTATNFNLAGNDTLCSYGTTTFAYHNVHKDATVTSFDANNGTVSYTTSSAFNDVLLMYDILCDGVVTDTATLNYIVA